MAEALHKADGIRFGPLAPNTVHLCIDMQNLSAKRESPWYAPWAEQVLPSVLRLVERSPENSVFTRFIPPADAKDMPGAWARYYREWPELTREQIEPGLLDLVAPLQRFTPPAIIIDKPVYSPFTGHRLQDLLNARQATTVVVSGTETDVCVLATILGAIDRGYRVLLAADAVCGSRDDTHDALLHFYRTRLSKQVEIDSVDAIIEAWKY